MAVLHEALSKKEGNRQMKRVAGLLLVCVLMVTAKVPVKRRLASAAVMKTAPAAVFQKPDPATFRLNADWWTGYQTGQVIAIPGPNSSFPDIWSYLAVVRKLELPHTTIKGILHFQFVNSYNVGVDSAIETAADWFWANDPESCHVRSCQ